MTALVIGATGLVGRKLVELLQQDQRYKKIFLLTRNGWVGNSDKIQNFHLDLNREFPTLPTTPDVGFCCLGTTIRKAGSQEKFKAIDYDAVVKWAKWMHEIHCQQIAIVSALGADIKSPFFYSRVKGEMEQAVRQIPFKKCVILQPSLLLGDREDSRPFENIAQVLSRAVLPFWRKLGFLSKYRPIEAQEVALQLILSTTQP